jgi:hypothetical protein
LVPGINMQGLRAPHTRPKRQRLPLVSMNAFYFQSLARAPSIAWAESVTGIEVNAGRVQAVVTDKGATPASGW